MRQPDLAVVSSPLQYVNAVEWRRRSDGPADLVLIGDRAGGAGPTRSLIARHPGLWRSVVAHDGRPRLRWGPAVARDAADAHHRSSLERLAGRLGDRGQVAFGDYRNVSQRALVAGLAADEIVLLDDGSVTPQVAAARAGQSPADPRFTPGWLRTSLGRLVFGERAPPAPAELTFFSIYGPLVRSGLSAGDRLVPHAFESWRAEAGPVARGGAIWLLGSNHVEAGICADDDYRRLIAAGLVALRAEGHAGPVVYRPHRGEASARVAALTGALGMALADDGTPAEIAYLDAAEKPALAVVTASTAADTLSVIDPELAIARLALPPGYLRAQRGHILAVIAGHDAFNPRLRVIDTERPA